MFGFGNPLLSAGLTDFRPDGGRQAIDPRMPALSPNPTFALTPQRGFFGRAVDRAGGPAGILQALSAATADIAHPGQNRLAAFLQNAQAQKLAQAEEEQKKAQQAQLLGTLAKLQANPNATRQDWLSAFGPQLAQQGNVGGLLGLAPDAPKEPTRYSTRDGIVEIAPDGTSKVLYAPTPEPRDAPSGFRWKADGSGLELIPGYAEGQAAVTGSRRKATIALPMPSRARSGGGGRKGSSSSGATAKLPAGFVLD